LIQCLALSSVAPQAWKNGGGKTRELLAWPSSTDWQLRVSVADIESDGPFSAFLGVDRWFTVLSGAGVLLDLPAGERRLRVGDAPLQFDGSAAPGCCLIDGATIDLNFMLRTAAGKGRMHFAEACETWQSAATWRGVYSASDCVLDVTGETTVSLPAHSLAWSSQPGLQSWRVSSHGAELRAWWLSFSATEITA
jgi:uncharacterized protein